MSGKTGIQWTDRSWNPTVGCTRVSAGCDHCYAFDFHDRRMYAPYIKAQREGREVMVAPQFHQPFSKMQMLPKRLADPLHWREPQKVFVNSMSDLFHESVSDEFIVRVFGAMAATPQHTYQILTKRPERMRAWTASVDQTAIKVAGSHLLGGLPWRQRDRLTAKLARVWQWPLPNVWLGVSVENQAAADERIPLLLQTPAAVRFLSCEPLLGPVNLERWLWSNDGLDSPAGDLDWVIIGGESGPHARAMNARWAESLTAQCQEAGIAAFVKQLGSVWATSLKLRDKHGGDMSEWPADLWTLQVREFPTAEQVSERRDTDVREYQQAEAALATEIKSGVACESCECLLGEHEQQLRANGEYLCDGCWQEMQAERSEGRDNAAQR